MGEELRKHGTIRVLPGASEIRLSRRFAYPVERVWAALSEPDQFAKWLAPGSIDAHDGGTIRLHFPDSGTTIESIVSIYDPPRALGFSWSGPGEAQRPLVFETSPQNGATVLSLIVQIPSGEDAAKVAAGFEAHVEMLDAALGGAPIPFPFALFKSMRAAYQTA